MNWKYPLIAATAAAMFATGCVPAQVEGTFVSGHLGNYLDCPGDGYTASSGDSAGRAAPSSDAAFAPCPEGETCNYTLNCEDAQATVRLSNISVEDVRDLQVEKIELLDGNGHVRAELPWMSTTDTTDSSSFDGQVDGGEELDLRIDFQGPADVSEFVKDEETVKIRITFDSDEHPPIEIDSDELYRLPSVVT